MHLVFDFVVLRFDFDYILFIYLLFFDIHTYVACLKFIMLFLVKLIEARDFRLELLFIWHHKSNTLIDLRTSIDTFIQKKCSFAETVIFLVISIFSLFLAGSPGFFNEKIKYLQISIFLGWEVWYYESGCSYLTAVMAGNDTF